MGRPIKQNVILIFLSAVFATATPANASLPARVETVVKRKLIPAYQRDVPTSINLLSNLFDQLDGEEITEVNEILSSSEVPTIGELMLDARMNDVLAKNAKLGRPNPREAAYSMPILQQRISDLIADVEGRDFYAEELPTYETMQDYRDVFWEIHVTTNRLKNAAKMARYGDALVNRALQGKLKKLTDEETEQLNVDFKTLHNELKLISEELSEIKAELRINAVTRATNIVRESKDFKERLRAAYVIDFDGNQVVHFLRGQDKTSEFTRPLLKDPKTLSSMLASLAYARESAGDLALKSRLLYLGMSWWMRGRYGEGPDGMGLLKHAASLSSPMAQFPLYMPMKPPTPIDPTVTGYSIPKFDRRHHYIWMYEYRSLVTNESENRYTTKSGDPERKITNRVVMENFY